MPGVLFIFGEVELTNPQFTKAEALHQAQLALFKKYKALYYWAPYVLVGNWL